MGSKRLITTVGIKIDADAIHIANNNARRNDVAMRCHLTVAMRCYLPNFDTLDNEEASVVMRAMQQEQNKDRLIVPLPDLLSRDMYNL